MISLFFNYMVSMYLFKFIHHLFLHQLTFILIISFIFLMINYDSKEFPFKSFNQIIFIDQILLNFIYYNFILLLMNLSFYYWNQQINLINYLLIKLHSKYFNIFILRYDDFFFFIKLINLFMMFLIKIHIMLII